MHWRGLYRGHAGRMRFWGRNGSGSSRHERLEQVRRGRSRDRKQRRFFRRCGRLG
jgi:hypothetical protein